MSGRQKVDTWGAVPDKTAMSVQKTGGWNTSGSINTAIAVSAVSFPDPHDTESLGTRLHTQY